MPHAYSLMTGGTFLCIPPESITRLGLVCYNKDILCSGYNNSTVNNSWVYLQPIPPQPLHSSILAGT